MASSSLELLSFRRTFALLMLLVALPSAALSGFGVLAIINERAAVEKRLEAAWSGHLASLASQLESSLGTLRAVEDQGMLSLFSPTGERSSDASFTIREGQVSAADPALRQALLAFAAGPLALSSTVSFFSVGGPSGTFLVAAKRSGEGVAGARLSSKAIEEVLAATAKEIIPSGEAARFELWPILRSPDQSPVGRLLSGVADVREAALGTARPLASRALGPPLQDFRLVVLPLGEDPAALASTRNRVLYGVLLALFYLTLALGVVYTARTLYREARLSRLKTDFVSLVSHELRTPLTSIRLFIETLELGRVENPEQTRQVLAMLSKETARLSEMIEGVLDWARIESGKQAYHREPRLVQELLDASLAAFRAQRASAPLEPLVELEANLPPVQIDLAAVAGALLNLLQNAYKYTGEDKRILVRARKERRGVAIEVQDNGIGIAPKEQKRIFERFYRVDDLLARRTEGSGLGLSIAQRIVQANGGRITVRSRLGEGSTFTIHLPKAAARA